MFDDDWESAEWLYPRLSRGPTTTTTTKTTKVPKQNYFRPPITLLVISVGNNIVFDPTREEISVADSVLAVSVGREGASSSPSPSASAAGEDSEKSTLKLISVRTIDPPARLTNRGIPNSKYEVMIGIAPPNSSEVDSTVEESEHVPGVWKPRRGGVKRAIISRIVSMVLKGGGVGEEVMDGLEGVDV